MNGAYVSQSMNCDYRASKIRHFGFIRDIRWFVILGWLLHFYEFDPAEIYYTTKKNDDIYVSCSKTCHELRVEQIHYTNTNFGTFNERPNKSCYSAKTYYLT